MAEIEFRKAIVPDEIAALCEFDRRAFDKYPADIFPAEEWLRYESYWMIMDGKIVGCVALKPKGDELWIMSTAILPEYRRRHLGTKCKQWQIEYAKSRGFARLGTMMRQSNTPIIRLNEAFGFKRRSVMEHAYPDPDEPGIVMGLALPEPVCPRCSKPLRTRRARQCRFCHADW